MKLRHFIGDVKLMLENDENEIMELIDKTIYILNQWKIIIIIIIIGSTAYH